MCTLVTSTSFFSWQISVQQCRMMLVGFLDFLVDKNLTIWIQKSPRIEFYLVFSWFASTTKTEMFESDVRRASTMKQNAPMQNDVGFWVHLRKRHKPPHDWFIFVQVCSIHVTAIDFWIFGQNPCFAASSSAIRSHVKLQTGPSQNAANLVRNTM